MATAVLSSAKVHVSKPLPIASHSRRPNHPPDPSSSRYPQPTSTPDVFSSTSTTSETASKSFQRFFENTFRTATRSKKAAAPPTDEFATITAKAQKGKGRDEPQNGSGVTTREKVFRKVTFRGRGGRDSPSTSTSDATKQPKERVAGKTSFITPSMRQASMSSPALHLSSQALPSPRSQPAAIASSSSNADVLVSPTRPKGRRISLQPPPREMNNPSPASPTRHRSTKSTPVAIPPSPSTPSLPLSRDSPAPSRARQLSPTPSQSPSPYSKSRPLPIRIPPKSSASAAHAASPSPVGSPSAVRVRVATPSRGIASSSTSHLPLSSSPSPAPRRPSLDSPHRPPLELRRSSGDYARRPSLDVSSSSRQSPTPIHGDPSSPIRARSRTPSQRGYSQNRHFNISAGSLLLPSNPEQRELIRSATSMLCKEVLKPPPHMAKTQVGIKDWEEVEIRTRALVRLERIWSRPVNPAATPSSPITSASGEERERKLFCEALRDGFVLCQLLNKQRASSVVRPDPREDGFVKTSNITKFLAGCASYGLSNDDLFHRDDLIEASSESLARVAQTIIALIQFVESPQATRKYILATANRNKQLPKPLPPSPYGTLSKSSSSTPNLLSDNSPSRKRWSPPSDLPPLRSYSPGENSVESVQTIRGGDEESMLEDEEDLEIKPMAVPIIKKPPPPPKSPLRKQLSKPNEAGPMPGWARVSASPTRASVASSAQATVGDTSIRESYANFNVRQSMASSVLTSTTGLSTAPSSLLDNGRSSAFGNKYGTIRTVTTDMTSAAPSLSREEGSAIAESLARTASIDIPTKQNRRSGEAHNVDLSRVAEETDESGSSDRTGGTRARNSDSGSGDRRPQKPAVHLRKGKWPDDFLDAFSMPESSRSITPISALDQDESLSRAVNPVARSPPRKFAGVGDISQLPRRPTHLPRHSVDTPGLLPKDTGLRRDVSPESGLSISPSGRVMMRRLSSQVTRPLTPRSGSLAPRGDSTRGSDESLVPFPRSVSVTGDQANGPASAGSASSGGDTAVPLEKPERPRLRGRFQSDVEGVSGRRGRPNSYDELGVRPMRGRIESMVSLGVTSAATSASDLLARDSMDGSTGRALVVKEEGKPPTHFQLGNCIGRGQFGSVYRALNLNTGQMVAVKRIRLEGLKEEEVTQLMREVDLVKSLSHPSIVKYEGMVRDEDTLNIILEYAENGSLGQTLKSFGKFNERLVASYVVKILEGLHYLHNSEVVHCDLKAANILTTKNGNVKLSDFGVSLNLRAMEREIKDVAGTPNWMAPEVIELNGASAKSDIWSLGCTVIELLTGRPPYAEITNSMSVMFRIVEDDMPPLPEGCSDLLQDFLKQCLQKDPSNRPTAELLCEHEWLKESWLELKDLRPQDSIPFLRRVSTDMAKTDVTRYFAQAETMESPISENGYVRGDAGRILPLGRRTSNVSVRPPPDNDIAPRDHNFVKTTFSKPMMCRVCLLHVKKSAVLCAQCSLISHARCASSAPPTCDLRAQLLLYAQYAEKGNPSSAYSNPVDFLGETKFPVAMSEVPYIPSPPSASGRTDEDSLPPRSPVPAHDKHADPPPTAFKFTGFKRSRSNLTPEPGSPPSSPQDPEPRRRRPTLLQKRPDRPTSFVSDSGVSSLRSAATAAESLNSGSGGRQTSPESSSGGRSSKARRYRSELTSTSEYNTHGPSTSRYTPDVSTSEAGMSYSGPNHPSRSVGSASPDTRRHKRNAKSSGNCVIQ